MRLLFYWWWWWFSRNPNDEGLTTWEAFSKDHKDYQILQPDVVRAKDFKADAMEFWVEKLLKAFPKHTMGMKDKGTKRDEL